MEKQKWTDVKVKEPERLAMQAAGKTRQEIADELELTKLQVNNWVNRHYAGKALCCFFLVAVPVQSCREFCAE